MFMNGGSLVSEGYQPPEKPVKYKAEGKVPKGAGYLLIRNEDGEGIFERSPDGSAR